MLNSKNLPRWLDALLSEKFFNACIVHEDSRKNEKNIFCLDCCEGICPHCLSAHHSHRLLQIRRYVYNDVLRVCDAQKLIDCSYVQSYTNNSAKVMFIKQRPQTRPCRVSTNICTSCDRGLQDPYLFCSLSCKLKHILRTEGRLTKDHVFEFEGVSFPELGFDDGLITPDSVLEQAGSYQTESGSSGAGCVLACTATTETMVRKKRSSAPYKAACEPVVSTAAEVASGRRKNPPHRSPLY